MEWKDEYSVGIPEIDRDHKTLASCVTEIEEAAAKGERWSIVHFAIAKLLSFSRTHFDIEESIMRIQQYPQLDDHIVGHVEFLHRIEAIEEKSFVGPLSNKSIEFLHVWLEEHFVSDDKHYASYLSKKT